MFPVERGTVEGLSTPSSIRARGSICGRPSLLVRASLSHSRTSSSSRPLRLGRAFGGSPRKVRRSSGVLAPVVRSSYTASSPVCPQSPRPPSGDGTTRVGVFSYAAVDGSVTNPAQTSRVGPYPAITMPKHKALAGGRRLPKDFWLIVTCRPMQIRRRNAGARPGVIPAGWMPPPDKDPIRC
jgi:hypothetical protein